MSCVRLIRMCPCSVSSFSFCSQKKWKTVFESKCENETEGDVFHKFNRSVKQEPNLNVVLPEDPRTRRRRMYKLASEPKPKFPFQPRNFYSQTVENKDVVKSLALLSSCTSHVKPVSVKIRTIFLYENREWNCENYVRCRSWKPFWNNGHSLIVCGKMRRTRKKTWTLLICWTLKLRYVDIVTWSRSWKPNRIRKFLELASLSQ